MFSVAPESLGIFVHWHVSAEKREPKSSLGAQVTLVETDESLC